MSGPAFCEVHGGGPGWTTRLLTTRSKHFGSGCDTVAQLPGELPGGHGMPIEGEWYTSNFRHAVGAQVEGNSPYRELEGADRISHRLGGDRVPLGSRAGSFLSHATGFDGPAHQVVMNGFRSGSLGRAAHRDVRCRCIHLS